MPPAAAIAGPLIGGIFGLIGASQQQAAASQAAALSKEQLEIYKRVVDEYLKEQERMRPYREFLRSLGARRTTWAPSAWGRWTSDPWRLTTEIVPPYLMQPPPIPSTNTENNPPTSQPQCGPFEYWNPYLGRCIPVGSEGGGGPEGPAGGIP